MSVSVQPNIEKLNYENYISWTRDIKFLLDGKTFWKIVLGTEEKLDAAKTEEFKAYISL